MFLLKAISHPFFIDTLLVRIHFIIVMIRWTGLAPWEFEIAFPGILTSTFLGHHTNMSTSERPRYRHSQLPAYAPSTIHHPPVSSSPPPYPECSRANGPRRARPGRGPRTPRGPPKAQGPSRTCNESKEEEASYTPPRGCPAISEAPPGFTLCLLVQGYLAHKKPPPPRTLE